jgi:hypothetical protein
LQPVFKRFFKIFNLRQPATQPAKKTEQLQPLVGCTWLRSVWLVGFFWLQQPNPQTLLESVDIFTFINKICFDTVCNDKQGVG